MLQQQRRVVAASIDHGLVVMLMSLMMMMIRIIIVMAVMMIIGRASVRFVVAHAGYVYPHRGRGCRVVGGGRRRHDRQRR